MKFRFRTGEGPRSRSLGSAVRDLVRGSLIRGTGIVGGPDELPPPATFATAGAGADPIIRRGSTLSYASAGPQDRSSRSADQGPTPAPKATVTPARLAEIRAAAHQHEAARVTAIFACPASLGREGIAARLIVAGLSAPAAISALEEIAASTSVFPFPNLGR